MKILHRGDRLDERRQAAREWSEKVECHHCGSRLLIEAADVFYEAERRPDQAPRVYATCPVCGRETGLTLVPDLVLEFALELRVAAGLRRMAEGAR